MWCGRVQVVEKDAKRNRNMFFANHSQKKAIISCIVPKFYGCRIMNGIFRKVPMKTFAKSQFLQMFSFAKCNFPIRVCGKYSGVLDVYFWNSTRKSLYFYITIFIKSELSRVHFLTPNCTLLLIQLYTFAHPIDNIGNILINNLIINKNKNL